MVEEIAPGLWHWTARHESIRIEVSSYYLLPERVLIDPILPPEGLDWFAQREPPEHALLTNRHHDRHAWRLREAFGCTVHCVRNGVHELEGRGPVEAFDRARPLFEVMGKSIVHVGDSGAGQVCKACNQLVVGATIEAVAEALLLAKRSGADAAKVREALLGGFAGSKVLEVHGRRMLDGSFEPGFRARLHAKDSRIVLDAAREAGSPVPSFEVVAEMFGELVEEGDGDLDHSALFKRLSES